MAGGREIGSPLNQCANNIFLSHSCRDKNTFVDSLYVWLTRHAGLQVWYDCALASGAVSANLTEAIDSRRAALIVLSRSSIEPPWVNSECEHIQKKWANRTGADLFAYLTHLSKSEMPIALYSTASVVGFGPHERSRTSMDSAWRARLCCAAEFGRSRPRRASDRRRKISRGKYGSHW
jgi:hypothetical protein